MSELLALINAARAQARSCGGAAMSAAPAVTWDNRLGNAAMTHSTDMAVNNFMGHTGSDGSNSGQRAAAAGYAWGAIGENVAAGYSSEALVVQGWLSSPGHCVNIMNTAYIQIGASCMSSATSNYGRYWTLKLARPQ